MKSITLVNPPSPFLADPMVMPSLGILYVAASLKKRGVKVHFEDLAKGIRPIRKSDFYGVSANSAQFLDAVKILQMIKTANPDAQVCIGGPHATLLPEECLKHGFDTVIAGEGEYATSAFLSGLKGIINAPTIENLDRLPFPDRRLVKGYKYEIDGRKATTIITSRGCIFSCAFCCKNWKGARYRSWQNVAIELEEIKEAGYEAVMFYDDELLIRRERDKRIFDALSDLGLFWRCFTRADLIDEPTARFMYSRGCREILVGIESGSDTILSNINKGVTAKRNKEAIKIINDAGIRVKAAMIIGLPGEAGETLKETWSFCEEAEDLVDSWDFSLLVPYPSSPIYENPEDYDIQFVKGKIYEPYKGGEWTSMVSTTALSEDDITDWRNKFHRRFKGEIY